MSTGVPSAEILDEPTAAYAVSRFIVSWTESQCLGPDQAVLLRQALKWLKVQSLYVGPSPAFTSEFRKQLLKAGVELDLAGSLSVRNFTPAWSTEKSEYDQVPVKRAPDEAFSGEAYLQSIGYRGWRSHAQKEAAWTTINSPLASTRIVVLPTGSGKSLCFQLLPRFSGGLTVVVVPTIALAIDQQVNAAKLFAETPEINPLYFASDDDAEITIAAVKEKRTRLLFTSPEACVSGRLRPILDDFSKRESAWFTNLVVDEAHLIETWGAQFRVEFQVLSAARQQWLLLSAGKLRTFLFSATMSPHCRELLHKMFSEESQSHEFISQRIRPEIQYYSHHFPDKTRRDEAAIGALWHLPRPAILYVTEKSDAESLLFQLRNEGFKRIECFHGDTRWRDRKEILRRWKNNEIDLMVATSAFGVGVDKPDVRTVLHACFPENLDRYYQEVGRGGRDGWTAVSLLMTSPEDRRVAENITVNLMTAESVQERWKAMFDQSQSLEHHIYALPMASRRISLVGTHTYGENIRWNKRLLLQLQRAGLLRFINLEFRPPETTADDPEEWAIVEIKFPPYSLSLGKQLESERQKELAHFRSGLTKLDDFLLGSKCAARMIGKLYDIQQPGCPGCPFCRREGRPPSDCEPLRFPETTMYELPFTSELISDFPAPIGLVGRINFVDAVSRCVTNKQLRQYYCSTDHFETVLNCFKEAFPQNTSELHRIDPIMKGTHISLTKRLPIGFFHIGSVNNTALSMSRGFPSVHFFCGVVNPNDANGRHARVNERLRDWPSLQSWLSHPLESSLPCLPTTQ